MKIKAVLILFVVLATMATTLPIYHEYIKTVHAAGCEVVNGYDPKADKTNPCSNTAAQYTLLEPLPCIPSPESKDTNGNTIPAVVCKGGAGSLQEKIDFTTYVQYIFNLIIAISAVAAVLVIVAGGFKYVTTDSFGGKSEGKKMIWEALKGLLLVLCSFLILRTIDPRLVSIPSTIVKPLDVKYDNKDGYGFFDQLASEAAKYHVNMDKYRQDVEESKATIADLEKKKEDVLKQIQEKIKSGLTYNDPEVQRLGVLVDASNDQINMHKGNIALTLAKGSFDTITYEYGPSTGTSNGSVDTALTRLDATYTDQKKILKMAGAGYDQRQDLDNYKNYTEAALKINEQVALINDVKNSYVNNQTEESKLLGGIVDSDNPIVDFFIPNSLKIVGGSIDSVTFSKQEYEKKLVAVSESSDKTIDELVKEYSQKINDPELVMKMERQAVDIQKNINTDVANIKK